MEDVITLQTKEQLDIFMNPQRQRLLRILEQSGEARTPKDLSVMLGISPSSVQHHLKKLESIGLVRVDHTANIRGILAKYYAAARITVHIGAEHGDDLSNERSALIKMFVAEVLDHTVEDTMTHVPAGENGDVHTGTVFLPADRKAELENMILAFLQQNAAPAENTEPWEYALIYHRVENPR